MMKVIAQVNIHITPSVGKFTAAMLEDRGGLELSYIRDVQYPLHALPAFEEELAKRGYEFKPGIFNWLRWWQKTEGKALPTQTPHQGHRSE